MIRGNTVGTTTPRANFDQTDARKADYIKGREKILTRDELDSSIELALAIAKESGDFDGKDGTSVTVSKVTESSADGGSNIVNFSNGKTLTVKNGSTGGKGDPGKDGADGLSIYELSAIATTSEGYTLVEGKNVSIPEGRTISVGDLLLAPKTNTIYKVEVVDYYGAVGLHAAVELMKLSYTLTEQDKSDIANAVLAALPSAEGVGF